MDKEELKKIIINLTGISDNLLTKKILDTLKPVIETEGTAIFAKSLDACYKKLLKLCEVNTTNTIFCLRIADAIRREAKRRK
ncbi:hypothetical protein KKC45_00995 [Patescibacteria group bacterium]|nr:hypothetical protein [Patescibacteria group bacterium]